MERMCSALQLMSKQFSMLAPDDAHEGDELAGLGDGLMKLTDLLQVSLGDAGTKIITSNLKGGGEINAMQPGEKMNGYFGFCFVHDFAFLLEALEEDVMIFTNIISEIVHTQVSVHLGSPNKNIGDSWLCVWNHSEEVVFTSRQLDGNVEMTYADHAVVAFAGVIAEVKANEKLKALTSRDSFASKYPNGYQVKMGFGLHYGWAIEGAVGSAQKMDATYLSPHVNMSARLEAASVQMNVDMLVSETFYKHMTPEYQRWVYKVDRVVVVGATNPMILYAYDDGPDEQNDYLDKKNRFAHEFDKAVEDYIHGNWSQSKKQLYSCLGARPDNAAATRLIEIIDRDQIHGESPEDFPGFRVLTSK
jgi:class 3 adenylate cyclase